MSSHSLSQESQRSTQEPRKSPSSTQLASGLFNGGFDCEREYAESERSAHSEISSSRHETRNKKDNQRSNEWEIIEGLKEGQTCESVPCKCEGYLLKRRKWPLKGWHKRYFCLDRGILTYAKSPTEMAKGKAHGSIDVGLSVISTKLSSRRIDIDAEEYIYHIKIKNKAQFLHWVAQLKHHRLYRQHEIAFGSKLKPHGYDCSVPVVGVAPITSSPVAESKVANWILDFSCGDLGKELADLQVKLVQLSSCLQSIELQLGTRNEMPDVETGSFKKYRRRFLLRRHKKSGSVTKANDNRHKKHQSNLEIIVSSAEANCDVPHGTIGGIFPSLSTHLSTSHTSLNEPESELQANTDSDQWMMTRSFTEVGKGGSDMGSANNLAKISQEGSTLKSAEDFINLAGEILRGLRSSLKAVQSEKEMMKTKQLSEVEGSTVKLVASLQQSLQQVMNQNYELKQKLMRIHEESEVTSLPTNTTREASASSATEEDLDEPTLVHQPIGNSKSYESSSVLSISEYFDAAERLSVCTTSSEDEDDGSFATDASEDDAVEFNITSKYTVESNSTGRRSKLPAPKPDLGDISLWSLLYKNIGKDLSKICMPVILNEPLNALQRLCEELEYSELLDKAASIYEPIDRMIYVAAFAVSAYGSSCYRAGHKPFNPLLGETYECVREDKGFRFISEQVSHHPPVSACHAESENYVFWQGTKTVARAATYIGQIVNNCSMEVIPCGTVHLLLKRTQSHYRWNKVTTCVHNIFKGQRWVDQYGEMTITDDDFRCKLTFMKASYWNNKRHEICGVITSRTGEVLERIYGKWNEALYCGLAPNARCIWRPAAIPYDHELFYGFTRFAIELNELHPDMVLPPTDTRFRPDQRLLEEGKVQLAECVKMKLEQRQRERRKRREEAGDEFKPLWFKREMVDGEETWIYNGEYWKQKENGFEGIEFESLWPSEILDGESN
ncbi:oxysterol-binding protein-related protein 3-like protein [Dinothrombium tinctorium]|uniref:Oxysterol-binding protein n=1 Tax=Dinothrombium tinctorium TaxID=1965070 RepID=A0A443RCW2_9ACAR|nr:oxysterol-binding protein-related protein 3-like protein [Dinothrombium tinctorium]